MVNQTFQSIYNEILTAVYKEQILWKRPNFRHICTRKISISERDDAWPHPGEVLERSLRRVTCQGTIGGENSAQAQDRAVF